MKLPDFKTKKEEIRFWERHSIGDYWIEARKALCSK